MSKKNNSDLQYSMRVKVFKKDHVFGPGIVEILKLVDQNQSLAASYKIMGLSSSKGWKLIKRAEDDLGFELIESTTGGKGGGHSSLTEEGREILGKYQAFIRDLSVEADKLFAKHFK